MCVYTKNGSAEVLGRFCFWDLATFQHHSTTRVYCLGKKTGTISFLSSFFADGMTATCGRGFFFEAVS